MKILLGADFKLAYVCYIHILHILPNPILGYKSNLSYVTLELINIRNTVLNHLIVTELKMLFFIKVLQL